MTEAADTSSRSAPEGWLARLRAWLGRTRKEREVEASFREAIEELIEERETAEPIAADERALIANIFKLRTLTARDVMVPRSDIDAIEIDTSVADLVKHMTASGHTRVPVYRGTLDDVLGMVHIKDVLTAIAEGRQVTLRRLLRKVMFVSPAMRTMDMMIEMREARTHMALVVDEFGGVDGLVTIEDLIEQIVGEIDDEHDETEATKLERKPDGSLVADARASLEEFEKEIGQVLSEEERQNTDTLAGLVTSLAGHLPVRGEVIRHPSGLEFEVVEADARRVKRLRVLNAPVAGVAA
ncbi:MAG: HlyC/CorC family transporter [Alphaproteobacteria bacterium]|nr:HlyC/CorC family transporter [Alphaproteobacteria bacterium]